MHRADYSTQPQMTDLARILAEQRACADYLGGDGTDKEGAWLGLCDWLMEEAILRLESPPKDEDQRA